jgi:hypothetical protein
MFFALFILLLSASGFQDKLILSSVLLLSDVPAVLILDIKPIGNVREMIRNNLLFNML